MSSVLVVGGIFREVLNGDTDPRTRYGGSGLTAAIAAARLGAEVFLVSYVGIEDEDAVRSELRLAGVHDELVFPVPGASGTFVFPSQESMGRPWPIYRPAESTPDSSSLLLPKAGVTLAFGIPDFDPISAGWLSSISGETTLIWDRQGWLSRIRDYTLVLGLAPANKVYLANEREAIEEARVSTWKEALNLQPPEGFIASVIKKGPQGVSVVERGVGGTGTTAVSAFPVRAVSTVGSGDVFAGALAACLSEGLSLVESVRWGCAVAAISLASGANLLPAGTRADAEQLLNSA